MSTDEQQGGGELVRASAWMALGTIVSRLSGFVRLFLLAYVLGSALDADIFNNANTVPNAVYILVAGGIFNVVLVPQLVRAMKHDADGGDAYAQRIMTLGLGVLALATVVLVAAAPWVVRLVFADSFFEPELAAQRADAELLMRLCMPQVFFYGAFVLAGQILNSRRRFGPMMWAPIVNNLVACLVLVVYAVVFGAAERGTTDVDGFTTGEAWLLGAGSTAGIVVQALVLVPYLRSVGFRFRPRFDLRGTGLGHTLRLGYWTLLFILVNQVAFVVVNRLATSATVSGATDGSTAGGSAVYQMGFLISQVPHGVVTVSLATALMPTLSALAADRAYAPMRAELMRTLRLALAVVAPIAVGVACLGPQAIAPLHAWGSIGDNAEVIGHAVQAFAPAIVLFSVHYVMMRGFYADEDTRTPFFVQVLVAATNITLAVTFVRTVEPELVPAALALAYGGAYLVGSVVVTTLLSRRIGRVLDPVTLRFLVRLVLALAVTAGVVLAAVRLLDLAGLDVDQSGGGLVALAVGGVLGVATYLLAGRVLRIAEIGMVLKVVARRR
ncbi:murein biosynthesis integral membrane protein MurJ [Aeromicrobium sp. IC_218]|uniref:murein biosynthesis integral membrane protein MurJ n=1 Tax=Aeromicrobium sp. IC_218 TaxID=2545468 RepID=UPI001F6233E6|nr:murein biosynthesis integral membrane protein MurJ [Aeromicrobium sp. IC_218]